MQCLDSLEQKLDFIGITAVEDKLQAEVPETIATLLEAAIKVSTCDAEELVRRMRCVVAHNAHVSQSCDALARNEAL